MEDELLAGFLDDPIDNFVKKYRNKIYDPAIRRYRRENTGAFSGEGAQYDLRGSDRQTRREAPTAVGLPDPNVVSGQVALAKFLPGNIDTLSEEEKRQLSELETRNERLQPVEFGVLGGDRIQGNPYSIDTRGLLTGLGQLTEGFINRERGQRRSSFADELMGLQNRQENNQSITSTQQQLLSEMLPETFKRAAEEAETVRQEQRDFEQEQQTREQETYLDQGLRLISQGEIVPGVQALEKAGLDQTEILNTLQEKTGSGNIQPEDTPSNGSGSDNPVLQTEDGTITPAGVQAYMNRWGVSEEEARKTLSNHGFEITAPDTTSGKKKGNDVPDEPGTVQLETEVGSLIESLANTQSPGQQVQMLAEIEKTLQNQGYKQPVIDRQIKALSEQFGETNEVQSYQDLDPASQEIVDQNTGLVQQLHQTDDRVKQRGIVRQLIQNWRALGYTFQDIDNRLREITGRSFRHQPDQDTAGNSDDDDVTAFDQAPEPDYSSLMPSAQEDEESTISYQEFINNSSTQKLLEALKNPGEQLEAISERMKAAQENPSELRKFSKTLRQYGRDLFDSITNPITPEPDRPAEEIRSENKELSEKFRQSNNKHERSYYYQKLWQNWVELDVPLQERIKKINKLHEQAVSTASSSNSGALDDL